MAGDELDRNLGVSRRDLMKRGAIVGGTILWVAPVIQSFTPAYAQVGSPKCGCCYCFNPIPGEAGLTPDLCNSNGPTRSRATDADCASFCSNEGYLNHQWCTGGDGSQCVCHDSTDNFPTKGCDCVS